MYTDGVKIKKKLFTLSHYLFCAYMRVVTCELPLMQQLPAIKTPTWDLKNNFGSILDILSI